MQVKLNGITDSAARDAALAGGAAFIGIFCAPHPALRLAPAEAGQLFAHVSARTQLVGCFRSPGDAELEDCLAQVPLDFIQLLDATPPARLQEIRHQFGLPLMQTVALATRDDLACVADYEQVADYLVFTARASSAVRGIGSHIDHGFDWALLQGLRLRRPWFLGGGIGPANMQAALLATSAPNLDITGGIWGQNGRPDPAKITEILGQARDFSPILAPTILE